MPNSSKRYSSHNSLALFTTSLVVAFLMLSYGFSSSNTNFEDLALGKETQSYFAVENGVSIHCSDVANAEKCLQGFSNSGLANAVLWLGNSQVHAVNQYKSGQETAAPRLYRWFAGQGLYFLTFSQPNASLQEHYVMFTYLKERLPLDMLVMGAVFDDTRESGIRDDIALAFADAQTTNDLGRTGIGRKILLDNKKVEAPNADLAGIDNTVQRSFESAINRILDDKLSLWAHRPEMRGEVFLFLYRARNTIFGIKPSSKRRMLKGRYDLNIQSLKATLESARESGIKVLLYIAPLRDDVPPPYIMAEYEMFKKDVQAIAQEYGASFANIENVVPAENWGMKDSTAIGGQPEYDYMHFSSRGHEIFANALQKEVSFLLQ